MIWGLLFAIASWFLFVRHRGNTARARKEVSDVWARNYRKHLQPRISDLTEWVNTHKPLTFCLILGFVLLYVYGVRPGMAPKELPIYWGLNSYTDGCGNPVEIWYLPEQTDMRDKRIEITPASRGTTLKLMGVLQPGQDPLDCVFDLPLKR